MPKNTLILTFALLSLGCSESMMNLNKNELVVSSKYTMWIKDSTEETSGTLLVKDNSSYIYYFSYSGKTVSSLANMLPKNKREEVRKFIGSNNRLRGIGEVKGEMVAIYFVEVWKSGMAEFRKKYRYEAEIAEYIGKEDSWWNWPLWTNFMMEYMVNNWEKRL